MDVVPKYEFRKIVQRHHGNYRVRKLSCWDQFISMCFGQLTFRHSLRDVTTTLNALDGRRYRMGFRNKVPLSTLPDDNATRPWQMYKDLAMVEKSFRDIKSCIQVRPIRHWREHRIEAHIYLCFLSLWLSKYIENKWKERNITTEVSPVLKEWDLELLICEKVDGHGNMVEAKWNKGKNAAGVLQQLETYGEANAIKSYW